MAKLASLKIGGWNYRKLPSVVSQKMPLLQHPYPQAIWDLALLTTDGTEGVTAAFSSSRLIGSGGTKQAKIQLSGSVALSLVKARNGCLKTPTSLGFAATESKND
jgi:hypothetical protein